VVEFAIVAPLLLFLLLGVVEFGLLFGKKLDVSQGAREGARLASVNYQATGASSGATQTSEIVGATCARMEVIDNTRISIDVSNGTAIGDTIVLRIEAPAQPVTGVFDDFMANTVVTSEVEVRLEQVATFSSTTDEACP
jgi:Flp pilus assembly protein TadG